MSAPPARVAALVVALLAVALALVGLLPAAALASAPAAASNSNPLTGNITGPSYIALGGNGTYAVNASGGPADVDGTLVGQINFTASLAGPNLAGTSVVPLNGSITTLGTPATVVVKAGNVTQTITLEIHLRSTLGSENATANLTYTIAIKVPYLVNAVVQAGDSAVLPFVVLVALDGVRVGNVTVPILLAHQAYQVVFRYASPGLPAGTHTFTLSLVNEHGLVSFANGQDSFSTTFYVAPPPPNNSVWYVAGAVAFFGALFIFATRVAARRRTPGRK